MPEIRREETQYFAIAQLTTGIAADFERCARQSAKEVVPINPLQPVLDEYLAEHGYLTMTAHFEHGLPDVDESVDPHTRVIKALGWE